MRWDKLVDNPELLEMWDSEEVHTYRKQLYRSIVDFKISESIGPERVAYHRGILEGLRWAQTLPQVMVNIEERKLEAEQREAAEQASKGRVSNVLSSMRFR